MKIILKIKRRYNGADVGPGVCEIEAAVANDWIHRGWASKSGAGDVTNEAPELEDMSIAALYKKAQELGISVKSQSSYRKAAGKAELISLIEEEEAEDEENQNPGEDADGQGAGDENPPDPNSGANDPEQGAGNEG